MERISGSMVAILERDLPALQKQVDLVSTQLNTEIRAHTKEIRAQTEQRIAVLTESGFDFEKVFFNSLYFDGLVILARVSLDLVAMMSGLASWTEVITGGTFAEKLETLMTKKHNARAAWIGHDPPFTACEVYDWIVYVNEMLPIWLKYDPKFVEYIDSVCNGVTPSPRLASESLFNQVAKFVLHDHIDAVLLGGPALFFFREHRRVKELKQNGLR